MPAAQPPLPPLADLQTARATIVALLERTDIPPDARLSYMNTVLQLTFTIQALYTHLLGGETDTYGTLSFFDPSRN